MDLNAKVKVNVARVDVNFQTVTMTYSVNFFHFDTNQHQGPTNTPYKVSAKYTEPFWRNELKSPGRRKFFRVDVNFQTAIVI